MSSADKKAILDALHQSMADIPLPAELTRSSESWQKVDWLPADAPWDQAAEQLEALGDSLHLIESQEDLAALVGKIVKEHAIKSAVRWDHPLLADLGIDGMLADLDVEAPDLGASLDEGRQALEGADLGITAAKALCSFSASLVLPAWPGWQRGVSLAPPVHLAIVRADARLADLGGLAQLMVTHEETKQGLPRAVIAVSGHSRTGDIEMILIPGVHGPGRVYVAGITGGLLEGLAR